MGLEGKGFTKRNRKNLFYPLYPGEIFLPLVYRNFTKNHRSDFIKTAIITANFANGEKS
jgi:hypothetical protein